MQIHVVQPGESLWAISQRYQVALNQVIAVNQLENPNRLVDGLALMIPTPNRTAIVRPGETVTTIANRYHIILIRKIGLCCVIILRFRRYEKRDCCGGNPFFIAVQIISIFPIIFLFRLFVKYFQLVFC